MEAFLSSSRACHYLSCYWFCRCYLSRLIVRFSTFPIVLYRIMYKTVDRVSSKHYLKLSHIFSLKPLFDTPLLPCIAGPFPSSAWPFFYWKPPPACPSPTPLTTTEQIFWFLGRDSITGASFGTMWEWYFRTSLDHWSTFLGMIFALNYPATAQWMKKVESMPAGRQWAIKGSVAIMLLAASAWWAASILPVSRGIVKRGWGVVERRGGSIY